MMNDYRVITKNIIFQLDDQPLVNRRCPFCESIEFRRVVFPENSFVHLARYCPACRTHIPETDDEQRAGLVLCMECHAILALM